MTHSSTSSLDPGIGMPRVFEFHASLKCNMTHQVQGGARLFDMWFDFFIICVSCLRCRKDMRHICVWCLRRRFWHVKKSWPMSKHTRQKVCVLTSDISQHKRKTFWHLCFDISQHRRTTFWHLCSDISQHRRTTFWHSCFVMSWNTHYTESFSSSHLVSHVAHDSWHNCDSVTPSSVRQDWFVRV